MVATLKRKVWVAAACLWAALVLPSGARAQWLTETYSAPAGYSALWVGLDLSHTTLDQLLASQTTISEVWRWNPPAMTNASSLRRLPISPPTMLHRM